MKKLYSKLAFVLLGMSVSLTLFSQNVAINTSGNSAYTGAILDLSNQNIIGTNGFLPPYVSLPATANTYGLSGISSQLSGLLVYNTNANLSGPGLYYWYYNATTPALSTWVFMGGGGASLSGGTPNYLARWTSATTLGIGIAQDNGTEVGIQTGVYAFTAGNPLLQVTANSTNINAISGISSQPGGAGVVGSITTSGIGGFGIKGLNASTVGGGNQFAIYGLSTVTSGNGYGLFSAATGSAAINYGGYFEATGGTSNFAIVVPSGKGNSGFGTTNPYSTVDDSGSFGTGTYNFTSGVNTGNYTLTTLANASTYIATPPATGSYILNLPSPAAAPRQIYTIVYYGNNLGTINIRTPINTIYQNGVASNPLPLTGGSAVLQSDGANWQVLSYNGAASANNGLSVSGTNVQLGGNNLIHASNIPLNGNTLSVTGSSEVTTYASTGQVGFGNAAPNAKAVVDLTNATNLGLMLPGITTANLPAITPAQNGLFIFNTTIGCPEYANGGVWYPLGVTHGSTLYGGSSLSVQSFTVPQCVTSISVVARGASGEREDFVAGNGAIITDNNIAVAPGQVFNFVVGQKGSGGNSFGGGGGGGTFFWSSANTTTPIVAAGGGGGGGGSGASGFDASTTTTPTGSAHTGAGGAGGAAGAVGTGTASGAGGGGWNTITGNPAAISAHIGQGGVGKPAGIPFNGGAGCTNNAGGNGGYGGGGGGGSSTNASAWGGGGGGGGYNGGGGGNGTNNTGAEYGGGGGGSCVNGANAVIASVCTSSSQGSLLISW